MTSTPAQKFVRSFANQLQSFRNLIQALRPWACNAFENDRGAAEMRVDIFLFASHLWNGKSIIGFQKFNVIAALRNRYFLHVCEKRRKRRDWFLQSMFKTGNLHGNFRILLKLGRDLQAAKKKSMANGHIARVHTNTQPPTKITSRTTDTGWRRIATNYPDGLLQNLDILSCI